MACLHVGEDTLLRSQCHAGARAGCAKGHEDIRWGTFSLNNDTVVIGCEAFLLGFQVWLDDTGEAELCHVSCEYEWTDDGSAGAIADGVELNSCPWVESERELVLDLYDYPKMKQWLK